MVFLLSRRLMRHFHPVVGIDRIAMLHGWHDFPISHVIAFQFVREEQVAKEADRGLFVASRLNEGINGVAILIDRTPEILVLPLNGNDRFIQMPGIPQPPLAFVQPSGTRWTKFQAPLANGFICDRNASFSEGFFHFPETEAEAMVEPHRVTDNSRRKTMALVADGFGCHTGQPAKPALS